MKYYSAAVYVRKIKEFKETLKFIDIDKADKKRDGAYSKALEQLDNLLEGRIDLEDIFNEPDNTLRNIMMLAQLDKADCYKN